MYSKSSSERWASNWTQRFYSSSGSESLGGNTVGPLVLQRDVTLGDPVSGFRKKIANGENATTYLSGQTIELYTEPMKLDTLRLFRNDPTRWERWEVRGHRVYLGYYNPSTTSLMTEARNQAISNFYSNLQSIETKFKGLVFTGELKESLSMIRHPATSLRRGIADYLSFLKKNGTMKRKH